MRTRVLRCSTPSGPGTAAYEEHAGPPGAEVRTSKAAFQRLLVFDREYAVIPSRSYQRGACLVKDRDPVAFAFATFEGLWAPAAPVPDEPDGGHPAPASDRIRVAVVGMLTAGDDDRTIARRLGIPVRTCQRHVACIMNELGARNRLHAGYLLRRAS